MYDPKGNIVHISLKNNFKPFVKKDFCLAHTPEYVDAFFNGKKPKCESNGLKWSEACKVSSFYKCLFISCN